MVIYDHKHYRLLRQADELEQLTDLLPLLKQHCALPDDESWTERDTLLLSYLDAAERYIDEQTGCLFRQRQFQMHLSSICFAKGSFRLPVFPVEIDSFSWIDSDGETGTLTVDVDYSKVGSTISLLPENVLLSLNTSGVPFPYTIAMTGTATGNNPLQQLSILTLATSYYKNPEGIGKQELSSQLQALLDSLRESFL